MPDDLLMISPPSEQESYLGEEPTEIPPIEESAEDPIAQLLEDSSSPEGGEEPSEEEASEFEPEREPLEMDESDLVDIVEWVDDMKASICGAIAQEEQAKFRNSKRKKERYARALSRYLSHQRIEITPGQTFLLASLLFFVPSIASALYTRHKKRQEAAKLEVEPIEEEPKGGSPRDSETLLKEVSESRRRFDLHANGCYKYLADGKTYIPSDEATERPSERVKILIDAGLKAAEIRERLGYE